MVGRSSAVGLPVAPRVARFAVRLPAVGKDRVWNAPVCDPLSRVLLYGVASGDRG